MTLYFVWCCDMRLWRRSTSLVPFGALTFLLRIWFLLQAFRTCWSNKHTWKLVLGYLPLSHWPDQMVYDNGTQIELRRQANRHPYGRKKDKTNTPNTTIRKAAGHHPRRRERR